MFHPITHEARGRHHRRDPRHHGPDGMPFGRHGGPRSRGMVRRGEVRPLILSVLATRPMHGYEVIGELEAQSGGRWRPSAGSIYPSLQQLADEGLVTGHDVDGRRIYTITDAGRKAAEANPSPRWGDSGRGPGDDIGHLVRRVAEAAFQVQKVGTDQAVEEAQRLLAATRAGLYRLLADESPAPETSDEDAPAAEA
jgi:DNA-binding PadR family transcriptional regulator